jgi:hypothetical protein
VRHAGVDDCLKVRLVQAHAKCYGSHYNTQVAPQEGVLHTQQTWQQELKACLSISLSWSGQWWLCSRLLYATITSQ